MVICLLCYPFKRTKCLLLPHTFPIIGQQHSRRQQKHKRENSHHKGAYDLLFHLVSFVLCCPLTAPH